MGWRAHQLTRAFSAYEFFDDSNLGRCPRLQMNRAFGANRFVQARTVTNVPSFRSLGTASITNAGGVADISRWCKPPVPTTKCGEPRQGRRNGHRAISAAPAGAADQLFAANRWFAPPANVQCP